MRKLSLDLSDVDNKTLFAYSISSGLVAIIAIFFANVPANFAMKFSQSVVIIFSFILAVISYQKKVSRRIRLMSLSFYILTYIGMWHNLSLSHHMVLVYLLSVMILAVLITRDKDRIVFVILLSIIASGNIIVDLFIREEVLITGNSLHQKYLIVITICLGILITGAINRIAFENAIMKLQTDNYLDHLTRAYNIRAFEENHIKLKESYYRYKENYVLIYMDIDNFKSINDTYGHATGDRVLIDIVKYMSNHIRTNDIIYRVGGDEFVIVMKHLNKETAKGVINRLIKDNYFLFEKNLKVHFSLGIVDAKDSLESNKDIVDLADQEMYKSKKEKKMSI